MTAVKFAVLAFLALVVLASCGKETEPPKKGESAIGAAAKAAKDMISSAEPAGDVLETTADVAEEGAEEAKKAAEEGAEAVEEGVETAKEAASTAVEEIKDVAEALAPAFSLDKLKELAAGLPTEKLTNLAGKLKAAIGDKEATVKGLKDKIAELGSNVLGGNLADLKQKLTSALGDLGGLKEKLRVVVDSLKAKGIDVSSFLGVLGGE